MKKIYYVILFSLSSLIITSCSKDDEEKDCYVSSVSISDDNKTLLERYISEHHQEAVYHPDGFYYEIAASGNGKTPTPCSNTTVNYKGTLTTGTVFDNANGVTFDLSNLIAGWKFGLPLIKEGGIITLYLPPELAYGSTGVSGLIPGNAITIFNIELLSVN